MNAAAKVMVLFGLAKFFASFFIINLFFQFAALAAEAGVLVFPHGYVYAPGGISYGQDQHNDANNVLPHPTQRSTFDVQLSTS